MKPRPTTALLGAALVGGFGVAIGLMGAGKLTLDTGWGRSKHALGPISWTVNAPRELVWQQFSSTYLGSIPRDMRDHLAVVERGTDLVVAWHKSEMGRYSTETVEAVGFEAPARIRFRHLRGPVPHAVEEFRFDEIDAETTRLTYDGELGLDWWGAGRLAARYAIIPIWNNIVTEHVETTIEAVTKRAESRRRRAARQKASV
jgi:hypothetical protein